MRTTSTLKCTEGQLQQIFRNIILSNIAVYQHDLNTGKHNRGCLLQSSLSDAAQNNCLGLLSLTLRELSVRYQYVCDIISSKTFLAHIFWKVGQKKKNPGWTFYSFLWNSHRLGVHFVVKNIYKKWILQGLGWRGYRRSPQTLLAQTGV